MHAAIFYETDTIAFCGSEKNSNYNPQKIVIRNLKSNCDTANSSFSSNISGIKILKQLIFVATAKEINLCRIKINIEIGKSYIENISKIPYDNNNAIVNEILHKAYSNINYSKQGNNFSVDENNMNKFNKYLSYNYNNFEGWIGENDNYYLAVISGNSNIVIHKIYENSFATESFLSINTGFVNIQSIFYSEDSQRTLGVLFVVESNGINIKAYKIDTKLKSFELISQLYRGKNESFISSVILLPNDFAAASSSNKTVHIFNLNHEKIEKNKKKSTSYLGSFLGFISNPFQLNKSIIKIRMNLLLDIQEDFGIYEMDFMRKGNIMYYDRENNLLKILGYNGKLCYYSIDLLNNSHKLEKVIDWSSYFHKQKKLFSEKASTESDFEILVDSVKTYSDENHSFTDDFPMNFNNDNNKIVKIGENSLNAHNVNDVTESIVTFNDNNYDQSPNFKIRDVIPDDHKNKKINIKIINDYNTNNSINNKNNTNNNIFINNNIVINNNHIKEANVVINESIQNSNINYPKKNFIFNLRKDNKTTETIKNQDDEEQKYKPTSIYISFDGKDTTNSYLKKDSDKWKII